MSGEVSPTPRPQQRILRTWRIWTPLALVGLFGAFGAPARWVPLFQVVIVVAATAPLVLGLRVVDGAGLSDALSSKLRRLVWALSLPLYLVVVALFFVR